MLAAVLGVISQIVIPLPVGVPLTLQVFAVGLIGYVLPLSDALAAVGVYIALGAVGVPVFSGLQGGLAVLTSPTGGFIIGFLPLVLCCSVANEKRFTRLRHILPCVGLLMCHGLGVAVLMSISGLTLLQGIAAGSLPYIVKDGLCILLAYRVSRRILSIRGYHNISD